MSGVAPGTEGTVEQQRFSGLRHVLPDGAVLITGAGIRFRTEVLKPGLVLITASGGRTRSDYDGPAESALLHELDLELLRSGELTIFADVRDASRMEASARELAIAWIRDNRSHLKASHVLVRSKLLEMAVSIIGMLVGGDFVTLYSQPKAFLELVRGLAPSVIELPTVPDIASTRT